MHSFYKWLCEAYDAAVSYAAFPVDFLFRACSYVLLTGRHVRGSFLLAFSVQQTPFTDKFTEAVELMEDFHPVVHPLLDHLCLSVSQCKQGERSSLVFFFPARGFSIHESFQDRWDMQSLQHVLGITGVSRTFPKR